MSFGSTIHLLIVEDDEDDYFLLETSLKGTSFKKKITWADSYDEAIHVLGSESFDLAIIDYRLGAQTGIDLATYIRDKFPFLPTILLTGLKSAGIDEEALRSGVYDYLAKDEYSTESIDRSIRYAIERSKVLRSLKESENRFKNLFENAVEYVFLVDAERNIIDANKAALRLFECDHKNKLTGLKISNFVNSSQSSEPVATSLEVEFVIPDLKKKCYCIMNVSVADTEKNIYQWVLHDITERILNEEKEKVLEKQALTGKFARIIAHEIKNPLTNIHLSLLELREILSLAPAVKQGADDPTEFINIIERNSKRINTLIEDLLNATRFDTIDLRTLSVDELIAETLTHLGDRARLKEIEVEKNIESGLLVKGDKEKLVIALLNILVNSVEAVEPKAGKVTVSASRSGNKVIVTLTDNGKGISPSDLPRLFEPFFTSKKGGTGLGLTATYNIITKHDASIKVNSELQKGTSFIISFPLFSE